MACDLKEEGLAPAIDLLVEQGLAGLTIRAVAARTKVSASSLVYRYKNRDGVLKAVMQAVMRSDESLWQTRRETLLHKELTRRDLPSLARSIYIEQAIVYRTAYLALWEFELAAERDPLLRGSVLAWRQQDIDFWEDCFGRVGLDVNLAPLWASGLLALFRVLLLAPPSSISLSWIEDTVARLFERLTGEQPSRKTDSVWRQMAETPVSRPVDLPEDESSTPYRIISAASAVILQNGLDGLTHRSIAERASVSLSSMTHHFKALEDIIIAAFWKIYRDARAQAEVVPKLRGRYSREEFLTDILPRLGGENQTGQAAASAMESILLRATRRPPMQETAIALFALMGATSTSFLQSLSDAERDFDRLDGHVFRLVLSGTKTLQGARTLGDPGGPHYQFVRAFIGL